MDLIDWFRLPRRRSWRKLVDLLSELPATSRFVEAQANDPEYAEALVARFPEQANQSRRPRLREWTPEVAVLVDIKDRLGVVAHVLQRLGGGRPPEPRSSPRPRTAIDVARAEAQMTQHKSLVAEVKAAQQRWLRNQQEQTTGG